MCCSGESNPPSSMNFSNTGCFHLLCSGSNSAFSCSELIGGQIDGASSGSRTAAGRRSRQWEQPGGGWVSRAARRAGQPAVAVRPGAAVAAAVEQVAGREVELAGAVALSCGPGAEPRSAPPYTLPL